MAPLPRSPAAASAADGMLRRGLLSLPLLAATRPAKAAAIWLVTEREAALAPSEDAQNTRAITRGPAIRYVSPRSTAVEAGRPFWLKIEFAGRGDARIDPASVRLTLLRGGTVDLTDRVRGFVSPAGIDLPEAMAPAGRHTFRVEVADVQGRRATTVVDIDVR